MVEADHVNDAIKLFGIDVEPVSRVVILGGTRIAEMTADILLQSGYEVLIVEEDRERAAVMARRSAASILQADGLSSCRGGRCTQDHRTIWTSVGSRFAAQRRDRCHALISSCRCQHDSPVRSS